MRPLVLADDVLGELDPERRRRFWAAVGPGRQVFATGTVPPVVPGTEPWRIWHVEHGTFTTEAAAAGGAA